MTRVRCFLVASAVVALGALATVPHLAPVRGEGKKDALDPDLDANRQLLDAIRADPERTVRLQRDWEAFQALPSARQETLRHLNRELRNARLARVLERYTTWREHLPEDKCRKLDQAATALDRLRLIRELREDEWLPAKAREELRKKNPQERAVEIRRLRLQRRQRRDDWQIAFRNWHDLIDDRPGAHAGPGPGMDRFVGDYLEPFLSKEEADRLHKAEARWPEFPRTLLELMDRHAVRLPGPNLGPTRFEELPSDVQQALEKTEPKLKEGLRRAEGSWPTYAIVVSEMAAARGIKLPRQLGPCYLQRRGGPAHAANENLPLIVQRVIREKMINKQTSLLADADRKRLLDAEGHWPEFPRLVLVLARKWGINLPADGGAVIHLPGPPQYWDRYRVRHPVGLDAAGDIPAQTLVDFALFDLRGQQRAAAQGVSLGDPLDRERLKHLYLKSRAGGRRWPTE